VPAVDEVTFAWIVQVPFAAMLPPVSAIDPEVLLTVPLHWAATGVPTIVTPEGSVSVNPTPVRGAVFAVGFVMVKVNCDVPPSLIVLGENAFAMLGGCGS